MTCICCQNHFKSYVICNFFHSSHIFPKRYFLLSNSALFHSIVQMFDEKLEMSSWPYRYCVSKTFDIYILVIIKLLEIFTSKWTRYQPSKEKPIQQGKVTIKIFLTELYPFPTFKFSLKFCLFFKATGCEH